MNRTTESKNKALVLEAFDTLFNKRNYAAAEKLWSPHYIQHSAHIAPGREGLFISSRAFRRLSNTNPERLWVKGISSSCTDDFRTSASL
jgi:predicted SnoaL-like aldol condensation-catalyzing enzyme